MHDDSARQILQGPVDSMLRKYLDRTSTAMRGTAMHPETTTNLLIRNESWYRLGIVICLYSKMYDKFLD